MRKFSKKQYLAAGAAAAIIIGGGGAAFAYWSSSGTGTGTATTGTSSNFTVHIDSVNLGDLTPGGPSDTVAFQVSNPNSGHQYLAATSAKVTSTSNGGCTADDFAVSATTLDGSQTYGDLAHGDTRTGTFTVQMINRSQNQDACKGVTVNLEVDAS
jgi:hypothetical protein